MWLLIDHARYRVAIQFCSKFTGWKLTRFLSRIFYTDVTQSMEIAKY